uniref:Retrotransposon gag domain-containing protein n=1 Tax=Photinus pyralis TaxID=7054 RepID=A0A1Y1LQN0_PHOPY
MTTIDELQEQLNHLKAINNEQQELSRRQAEELALLKATPPTDGQVMLKLFENVERLALGVAQATTPTSVLNITDRQFPKFEVDRPAEWPKFVTALNIAFSDTEGAMLSDSQKRRILLQNGGDSKLFNLAADLLKSNNLDITCATYQELLNTLGSFFKPKISHAALGLILFYAKFTGLRQNKNESALQFVARLRAAAADCNFGDKTEDLLLWQFVCGISNETVQQHLLNTEDKLSFQAAINKATTAECTTTHVRTLQGTEYTQQSSTATVFHAEAPQTLQRSSNENSHTNNKKKNRDKNHQQPTQRQTRGCYRCAGDHHSNNCSLDANTLYCTTCATWKHLAAACRGSRIGKQQPQINYKPQQQLNPPPRLSAPTHQLIADHSTSAPLQQYRTATTCTTTPSSQFGQQQSIYYHQSTKCQQTPGESDPVTQHRRQPANIYCTSAVPQFAPASPQLAGNTFFSNGIPQEALWRTQSPPTF